MKKKANQIPSGNVFTQLYKSEVKNNKLYLYVTLQLILHNSENVPFKNIQSINLCLIEYQIPYYITLQF